MLVIKYEEERVIWLQLNVKELKRRIGNVTRRQDWSSWLYSLVSNLQLCTSYVIMWIETASYIYIVFNYFENFVILQNCLIILSYFISFYFSFLFVFKVILYYSLYGITTVGSHSESMKYLLLSYWLLRTWRTAWLSAISSPTWEFLSGWWVLINTWEITPKLEVLTKLMKNNEAVGNYIKVELAAS